MSLASESGRTPWPGDLPYRHAIGSGELIFVGGQRHVGSSSKGTGANHLAQVCGVMDRIQTELEDLNADLRDIVKLVVFFVGEGIEEAVLLEAIANRIDAPVPPAVASVVLPALTHPGQLVEIECIAMRGLDGEHLVREASNPPTHWLSPFSHGIRCRENIFVGTQMPLSQTGEVLAPGDPVEQAKINLSNLDKVLAGFGCPRQSVTRINTFYLGSGTAADWKRAGEVRGNAFDWPGPVGTGVPVPEMSPLGVTQRQEAFAMFGVDGSVLERYAMRPEGHWDWPSPVNFQQIVRVGSLVYVGGQVSAHGKGEVLHAYDWEAQTHEIMRDIESCLHGVGARLEHLVKLNTFYADTHDPQRWWDYLRVTGEYVKEARPTTTVIPLEKIAIQGLELEIEAYAWVEDASRP